MMLTHMPEHDAPPDARAMRCADARGYARTDGRTDVDANSLIALDVSALTRTQVRRSSSIGQAPPAKPSPPTGLSTGGQP